MNVRPTTAYIWTQTISTEMYRYYDYEKNAVALGFNKHNRLSGSKDLWFRCKVSQIWYSRFISYRNQDQNDLWRMGSGRCFHRLYSPPHPFLTTKWQDIGIPVSPAVTGWRLLCSQCKQTTANMGWVLVCSYPFEPSFNLLLHWVAPGI